MLQKRLALAFIDVWFVKIRTAITTPSSDSLPTTIRRNRNYRFFHRANLRRSYTAHAVILFNYLRITPPPNLADFQGENTDKGYLVTITSKDKLPLKHFLEGDVLVVDITKPAPPQTAEAAKPAPAKPTSAADKPAEGKQSAILLAPPKQMLESENTKEADDAAKACMVRTAARFSAA